MSKSTRSIHQGTLLSPKRQSVSRCEIQQLEARLFFSTVPNDFNFSNEDLWGLEKIDAPLAWDLGTGNRTVAVAVLDTGVDYNHPDLAQNMWKSGLHGIDVSGNGDADPMDTDGHGTHVAGIIGARGNNGQGVTGVNWNVPIMAVKVLPGNTDDTVQGIDWVINQRKAGEPVRVMNLSLGFNLPGDNNVGVPTLYNDRVRAALQRAGDVGILAVLSAGNGGNDGIGDDNDISLKGKAIPSNVLIVAATDDNDNLRGFSNFGQNTVNLAAPGSFIWSTVPVALDTTDGNPDGYEEKSGTSMAAPFVAGAAALLWSFAPNASYQAVKDALLHSVDKVSVLSGLVASGGRLNLRSAIDTLVGPTYYARSGVVRTTERTVFNLADYNKDGVLDLYVINRRDANKKTQITVLDGNGNFSKTLLPATSTFLQASDNGNFVLDIADYNKDGIGDLFAVKRLGANNKTEVHVYDGKTKFQTKLLATSTSLYATSDPKYEFEVGDNNNDGKQDLYVINRRGESGKTELQILNGSNNFATSLLTRKILDLEPTDSSKWEFEVADGTKDGRADLYVIKHFGGSGRAEVFAWSGSSSGPFSTKFMATATRFGPTYNASLLTFLIGDVVKDGNLDLVGIRRDGIYSGKDATEVHIDALLTPKGVTYSHKLALMTGFIFNDADADGFHDAGESPMAGVNVWADDGDGIKQVGERQAYTDVTGRYQLEGLPPGNYVLQVEPPAGFRVTNSGGLLNHSLSAGESALLEDLMLTSLTAPAAPTTLAGTGVSPTQVNLTWTDKATNESGFEVQWSKASNFSAFTSHFVTTPNAKSAAATGLSPNTYYYFRVRAYNVVGYSAFSTSVKIKTQAATLSATALALLEIDVKNLIES